MTGWRPALGPSSDEVVELLATADLTVEGRMPWSSNLTFLVGLDPPGSGGDGAVADGDPGEPGDSGGEVFGAIYKPHRGERDLWDFPDGLYRREAAAWVLADALGWDIVPPTLVRTDGPFGIGNDFIEGGVTHLPPGQSRSGHDELQNDRKPKQG